MKVKELPEAERPREKAKYYGVKSLSNRELIALLIRCGYKGSSALMVSDEILKLLYSKKISEVTLKELVKIKGIKSVKAIELLASFELAQRMIEKELLQTDVISHPNELIKWLNHKIGLNQQEHFIAIFLNTKNRIIHYKTMFIGTLDSSIVHPREIFKEAVIHSASKLIVVHNHPSSDLTPSKQDIHITNVIKETGMLIGIPLVDHLIVNHNGSFSLMHDLKID